MMSVAPRTRWYLRPVPLTLLTLLFVAAAIVATVGREAWERQAALAWIEGRGRAIYEAPPEWLPGALSRYWPTWASRLSELSVTYTPGDDLRPLRALRDAPLLFFNAEGPLTETELQYLSSFYRLEYLYIRSPQVSDAGLAPLARCRTLRELELEGTAVGDGGLKHLAGLPLEALGLAETQVTDEGMDTIGGLKRLRRLSLAGTSVGDAGVARLKGLPLQCLCLYDTNVTDEGLLALGALPELVWLDLDRTDVGDPGLALAATSPALSRLFLSHTRITDAGLEFLRSNSELCDLYLHRTCVTLSAACELAEHLGLELYDGEGELEITERYPPRSSILFHPVTRMWP